MNPKIEVLCFTDPFCSWCWASEPSLFALRERYRDQLSIRWVMGGLVKDMSDFHDSSNGISTTADVAPHWKKVSERTGQPIDERLMTDINDPRWSTWPANVAVKAATLQSPELGDRYLRRLRRAALTERVQVQRSDEQLQLARQVPGLDFEEFRRELTGERAARSFEEDRELCAKVGASGFPTMLFRLVDAENQGERGILVGGFRNLATYEQVLAKLAPTLKRHEPRQIEELLVEYGPLTTREFTEILGNSVEEHLREWAAYGKVVAVELRGGTMWSLPGGHCARLGSPIIKEGSMSNPTIIAISGSLRKGSFNTALLRAAAGLAPPGVTFEHASLAGIPLYDGDLEAASGIPPSVTELKNKIAASAGLLISTPEYNSSIPGVLKNALDWLSRPPADAARVFKGRPVTIIGATIGRLGTALSQAALLPVLRHLEVQLWLGPRLLVGGAAQVFDSAGQLVDERVRNEVTAYMAGFVEFCLRSQKKV